MRPEAWDYYAGGACDERTLAGERAPHDRVWLVPRVLVDVSSGRPSTTRARHAGRCRSWSPRPRITGWRTGGRGRHRARRGGGRHDHDRSRRRRAAARGRSPRPRRGPLWFQLYVYRDRGLTHELSAGRRGAAIARWCSRSTRRCSAAASATCATSSRCRRVSCRTSSARAVPSRRRSGGVHRREYVRAGRRPDRSWDDRVAALADAPADRAQGRPAAPTTRGARRGRRGAVIVSNHGGRQLDGALPSIDALPDVVEAVGRQRRGAHGRRHPARQRRAQGAGARRARGAARPAGAVGLAAGGEDGVEQVLRGLARRARPGDGPRRGADDRRRDPRPDRRYA